MQVIKDKSSRCAIVIAEGPDCFSLLRHNDDGIVVVDNHPLTWPEEMPGRSKGEQANWTFWEYWKPVIVENVPYAVDKAARLFLKGINPKILPTFGPGSITTLIDCLPPGNVHLFTPENGFVGRFAEDDDAKAVARALKERAIFFAGATELKQLSPGDLKIVTDAVCPDFKFPVKPKATHYNEVFDMAKNAAKKKSTKVAKTEASKKRADGPVAKIWAIADKLHAAGKGSKEMIEACTAEGINRGTIGVQLGKWRKKNGIIVKRGGGPKVTKPATDKPKPAAKKKAAKKKTAPPAETPKPKAKKKAKGIPSTPAAAAEQAAKISTDKPFTPVADEAARQATLKAAETPAATSDDAAKTSAQLANEFQP